MERLLVDSLVNFDENGLREVIQEALRLEVPVEKIIDSMTKGMDIVGDRFEKGEYFLAELVMAGETMKVGLAVLKPYLKTEVASSTGTIVIGTVKGDLHDIGKNILIPFLISAGFRVHDLGVDVDAMDFVRKARETDADIVAMSVLLSIYIPYIKTVVDALKNARLRDKVKMIIGGGCTREHMVSELGVDAWAPTAIQAVKLCKELMENKKAEGRRLK